MARIGISYDEVKLAIDEMLSEGLNPTIAGLRERLGTGSFTTISEHLKRWRGERQEKPVIATGTPAPDALSGMMQTLWQQAREEANKELEQYKEKIDVEMKTALEEKQKALQTALDTENKNRWLEEKNNTLLEQISEVQKINGLQEAQLTQKQEQLELAQQQLASVKETAKKQHEEIQQEKFDLNNQLKEHQDKVLELSKEFQQQLKEERDRGEKSEQHWLAQLDSERQKAKQLSELLSTEKETQQKVSALMELLKTRLEQINNQQSKLTEQIAEQKQAISSELEQYKQDSQQALEQQLQQQLQQQLKQELGEISDQLQKLTPPSSTIWGINWQDIS